MVDIKQMLKDDINAIGEKEKQDRITKELLSDDELNVQYLDLGFTDEFWYYGKNIKGREAIITSTWKILRNTLEKTKDGQKFGENEIKSKIDYKGYLGDIAPFWSNDCIKGFLINKDTIDKREVYDTIKDKINYYMDFQEFPESADVQACWVIGTYCYPLFYAYPHVLFNAPSQSGKSKNAFILMKMSFRGFDLGASAGVTPAQVFRTIEGNRGTLVFDEYEQNNKSETQALVNQILNASITRDSYVIRAEQINKKWVAWKFPIFCPKIACNISGINPTSLSRFIPFKLFKTTTEKGKRKPYKEKDKASFNPITDQCHILIMQHWKEIKQIYDNLEIDLSNREEDVWLPLLAIAKFISDEVYQNVLKYITTYQEIRVEAEDVKQDIFLSIYDNVNDDLKYYSCKEIAGWLTAHIGHYDSPERSIGKTLKSYKFKPAHKSIGNGYYLSKENVGIILKTYFSYATGTDKTSQTSLSSQTSQTSLLHQKSEVSEVNEVMKVTRRYGVSNSIYDHFLESLKLYPDGMPKDKAIGLWGEETISKAIESGDIYESSPDILKVVK